MNTRSKKFLLVLRIIGIIFGISLLIYQIFSLLRDFNWSILTPSVLLNALLAFGINILAILLHMTAWKVVLDGMGHKISITDIFSGFSISFVARYIPGTVWGYLSRGEWLKREQNVPYSISHFCSIVETIGFMSANLFVMIQGLVLARNIPFTILFIVVFVVGSWASLNLFILWKPARRLFRLENNIYQFPFPKWLVVFLLFCVMWYCYGISLTIFANSIHLQLSSEHILLISSIYALSWFIGFIIPFIPSGLGLREYTLTILLAAQFGLEKSDASFIAIGFRVLVSLAELFWILFGLSNKAVLGINKLQIKK